MSHTHTQTCSEQSLRILMWNASCVQKTHQLSVERPEKNWKKYHRHVQCEMKPDDTLRRPCKSKKLNASNLENLETAWWFLGWSHPMSENEAGTWQRRPFVISPWRGSVLVGGWLPDHASNPCCMARSFTSTQMFHTHTHTPSCGRVGKLRSGQWDDFEHERKWKWGENESEMKVT